MPSQENIQLRESTDNLNHIVSYENDLKSHSHQSLRLKNGSVKPPPSSYQTSKGSRTDNYNNGDYDGGDDEQISTHELNSKMVCVYL